METSKEQNSPSRQVSIDLKSKPLIINLDRTNKALRTTKDLNKRLRSVKLLSQKNLLKPTFANDITSKRVGFASTKSTSRSHEVKLSIVYKCFECFVALHNIFY